MDKKKRKIEISSKQLKLITVKRKKCNMFQEHDPYLLYVRVS